MARGHKESASESESTKYTHPAKTLLKAKNQAALQAQQLYLAKHINSNGPQDQPPLKPLDFERFDDATLVRYSTHYNMGIAPPMTVNGDILNSEIGKKTYSKRSGTHPAGVSKPELAAHLKNHFMSLPCKENEIVTSFLYKVKNQDKDFKLTFR